MTSPEPCKPDHCVTPAPGAGVADLPFRRLCRQPGLSTTGLPFQLNAQGSSQQQFEHLEHFDSQSRYKKLAT